VAWPESFLKNGMAYQNKGAKANFKIEILLPTPA
jgi:hypothetical protein